MIAYAWISLARLGGCNYKRPIERRGRSVYVPHPQRAGRKFRVDAVRFDAGEFQCRNGWAIAPWDERAERIARAEQNWQD